MKDFNQFQEDIEKKVPPVTGLGGGGGGTNSITDKAKTKSIGKRIKDAGKLATVPVRAVLGIKSKPDPTEKFADSNKTPEQKVSGAISDFKRKQKKVNEGVAALAVGGSKVVPALMTGIGAVGTLYQASKKNGGSNFEKLRQQQQKGEGEDLRKKTEKDAKKPSTKERIKNALVDAGLNYKKGLSVSPTDVTGKKYRTPEMGTKKPGDYVRDILKKQRQNMKDQRARNKKIDKDLGK